MTYLNPWGLLFLGLVPAVILLYFLKLKRPSHVVPSTLLWRRVVDDQRVNSPFQRLKRSLLMILQILLIILLVLGLARLLFQSSGIGGEQLIVMIDTSLSMATQETEDKTRLEIARDTLLELIDNMQTGEQMMLIGFNDSAHILTGFSGSKKRLRLLVEQDIKQTDRSTDVTEGLRLVSSLAQSSRNLRVLMLSDGSFRPPEVADMKVPFVYRKIGTPKPNVAITSMDIRRSQRDAQVAEMFVSLENFGESEVRGNMLMYLDGKLKDSNIFKVAPGERLSQIFEAPLPDGGDIKVELDSEDAMPSDNVAYQVILPPHQESVLLVGAQTFFLKRVFEASPSTIVDSVSRDSYDPNVAQSYSLVVWNRTNNPEIAKTNNLYLNCIPPDAGVSARGVIANPTVKDWEANSPVNRYIDYSNLILEEATQMNFPEDALSVVTGSENTPLVTLMHRPGQILCVISFDPFASNWPLLVSFPLFMRNCMTYIDQQATHASRVNLSVGQPIVVPASAQNPRLTLPNGTTVKLTNDENHGEYIFSQVEQKGIYRVLDEAAPDKPISIAVNLFNDMESDLTPLESPPIADKVDLTTADDKTLVNKEYTTWFLATALMFLLLEWMIYQRRWFT